MAYELSWVVHSRVLLLELKGLVETDEMMRLVADTHALVEVGQAPIHVLIDATELVSRPVNFPELNQLSRTMSHDGIEWVILVKPAKMVWFASTVLSKVMQKKMKSADSIEEALTILQKVDFTIANQPEIPM